MIINTFLSLASRLHEVGRLLSIYLTQSGLYSIQHWLTLKPKPLRNLLFRSTQGKLELIIQVTRLKPPHQEEKDRDMSLFGSSPPEEPSQSAKAGKSQSLFDDERTTGAADSSIFDDGDGSAPSPWEMPTPKKPAKGDMVKTLLPAASVPDSYIDAFDTILDSGYAVGPSSITIEGATKLLEGSGLDVDEQASIISLVTGGQEPSGGLGRNEFNVLVALAGLAQEHDDATLDGVDERRRSMTTCCAWPAIYRTAD